MKKLLSFFAALFLCAMAVNAASITAPKVDFGTVSIKGQSLPYSNSQTVTVSFKGLATDGYYLYAEVSEGLVDDETNPNGFYVTPSYQYIGYGVGSGTMEFEVYYSVKAAGTFTGKLHWSSYDPSYNEVDGYTDITITVTDDAIVAKTIDCERLNSTSDLKEGDVVVFVSEAAGAVGGPLYTTYLPAITENVTIDAANGKAKVPETAQMFT